MKTKGIKEVDGKNLCEKCGIDLDADGNCTLVSHFDGVKEYGYIYNCKCGAVIKTICERNYDADRFKNSAPTSPAPNAKPVIWRSDVEYDPFTDRGYSVSLPECPTCHGYPTYNEQDCPFCGQPLDYSEKT